MTAVSKNVYFDLLDDFVDKYNKTCHTIIKLKPVDLSPVLMQNKIMILMTKRLNLK